MSEVIINEVSVEAKNSLRGRISVLETLHGKSAYEIAVINGFTGTEEEWLTSLKGEKGDPGQTLTIEEIVEAVKRELNTTSAKIGVVELPTANWVGENNLYYQVVTIEGVTERSQVDLTPSVEQLAVFYEKDLTFVTENDGGVVTVYVIGQKPQNDYTIQVTITETEGVSLDG